MADTRNKRTPEQRERDLDRIAQLYLSGKTQMQIADELGVSRQQIGYDLRDLNHRWQESAIANVEARKAQELAKIDRLESVAWDAWERSRQDAETTFSEITRGRVDKEGLPLPDLTKAGKSSKGQAGDPRFLERVAWCVETRLKVIGALQGDGATTILTVIGGVDLQVVVGQKQGLTHDRIAKPAVN